MFFKAKQLLRKIIPQKFILITHKIRAVIAAVFYGFPGKKIKVIGVAGTKGKTTTTNIITDILENNGYKIAMLSTANFQIADKKWLNDVKMTTPPPFYIQKFLKKAVEKKCEYAVIEISSHGLSQFRNWGIAYKTIVLTNMMSDHLDYHKTFKSYKDSHNPLISKDLKNLVINYDDENLRSFLDLADKNTKKYVFSLKGYKEIKDLFLIRAENIILKENNSEFSISFGKNGKQKINLNLIGEFNIYNSLAAASVAFAEGIDTEKIKKSVELIKNIPGRLEKINEGQNFEVIVDYAHSPDSLESVYKTIKPCVKNKLIAVLGGTGDRDITYRSKMGRIVDEYADIIIVTNEDPYSENPEKIIAQVVSGIKNKEKNKDLFIISDRKNAIKKAISTAKSDDMVVITGKGCEQFMIIGEKKIKWDDRKIAREAVKEKLQNKLK